MSLQHRPISGLTMKRLGILFMIAGFMASIGQGSSSVWALTGITHLSVPPMEMETLSNETSSPLLAQVSDGDEEDDEGSGDCSVELEEDDSSLGDGEDGENPCGGIPAE